MTETLLIAAAGLLIGLGIAALVFMLTRQRGPVAPVADPVAEARMAELGARVQQMGELLGQAQAQLQSGIHERLDAVTHRLGQSMEQSRQHTTEHLAKLNERLAVIDSAQKNITDLA